MYLSLSLGPGMTINYFAMTLRGEGGKGSKTYHNDGIFKFWRLCSTVRETTYTIAIVFVEHSVLVHSDWQGWGKLFRFKLVNRLNMWLKKSLPKREDFLMLWCQYTVSKQLEHGWNPNPTLLKYHAESNQHAMEMHEKDQIILKVLQQFLDFVDKNSASNGRKEGSHGKTFYFNPKFTQIHTPNKDDPQYSYKCKWSVLYEFNRTLAMEGLGSISVGTTFNWLKIGICPPMSDCCDTCKEHEEEISRCRQVINRLHQWKCNTRWVYAIST